LTLDIEKSIIEESPACSIDQIAFDVENVSNNEAQQKSKFGWGQVSLSGVKGLMGREAR
jgi:hypothetical protein